MVSSPAHRVSEFPLLETKLYIPQWRPGLVSRPGLIDRLDHGAERKLIVVSAPAGFGKTTLLAEWLAAPKARTRAVAWVSLSQADNDPALFWTYVISALQKVQAGVGQHALALLHASQPPPIEAILTTLINEINGIEGDFSLILDDVHVIDAQPIHDAIAFLLDHLPPQMHLVIASRADPPLPLARLRVRGDLTELGAPDLRFTPAEAAAFLNEVMKLDLTAGDVAALEARTEGWIAGLQLAALSMQGRAEPHAFVTAFAGDDRYILDYLAGEVLQHQPEPVRRFLLQTSILDRLSGPLCNAVTGRDDGTEQLVALERRNLFVVPLDDKRHWYRYHHLFADVLRVQLIYEQPDHQPVLRGRAAAWFEQQGMAAEAIEQAHASADHATVARLLAANIEEFERAGMYASMSNWSASLPDTMVQHRPHLAVILALSALRSHDNNRVARKLTSWAEEAINRIEDHGGIDPADTNDGTIVGPAGLDALKGEVLALKLAHSSRNLAPLEVAEIAARALELLPPGKHHVRGMIHMVDAGIQMDLGDLESAFPDLERAVHEARRAHDPLLLAGMLAHRGQVQVSMGRLQDGLRSYREAFQGSQHTAREGHWMMCGSHAWFAEALLEHGDLVGATDHVANALELAGQSPTRSFVLYARAIATQVLLAAGDTNAAIEQLEEAQAFVRGSSDSRFASFLSSVQLKVFCRTGDVEAAAAVARERGLSPDGAVDANNEEEMTAYTRYLLMRGDAGDAANVLSRVLPVVRGRGRVQHEIHALVLQAWAYELLSKREHALDALGRATMLGEPGLFNRTFTGEDLVVSGLVTALADAVRRGQGPAETGPPSYLATLQRQVASRPETRTLRSSPADLAEPLTRREIEVIQLIAAGMRNQEIADHLFISLSTVKRHIANAYGKLAVTHRTEAVARANELHLL